MPTILSRARSAADSALTRGRHSLAALSLLASLLHLPGLVDRGRAVQHEG